jgi:hypothetical protein
MEALQSLDQIIVSASWGMLCPEVVILYKDFPAGVAAKRFFDHLFRQIEPEGSYQLKMWDHQFLRHSLLRAEAMQDAQGAAIVCVSASADQEPEAALKQWAHSWANQKASHPCTLVALLGESHAVGAPLSRFLQMIAEKKGAEFFLSPRNGQKPRNQSVNLNRTCLNL